MVTDEHAKQTAHNLMLRALELLDALGEQLAAIHVQQAIDALTKAPTETEGGN